MFASQFSPSLLRPSPAPPVSVRSRSLRVSAACTSSAEAAPPLSAVLSSSSSSSLSLYEVLGLSSTATCHEIKAAYRRLARVCHPDVASTDRKDSSADEFMRLHAAYSTLSDPQKRADYDRKLVLRRRPHPIARSYSFGGYSRRNWETDQCW